MDCFVVSLLAMTEGGSGLLRRFTPRNDEMRAKQEMVRGIGQYF